MNRRALLAVLAAAGACVAFGVAGAAFADSVPVKDPAADPGGGSPGSSGGGGGESLPDRSVDGRTATCVRCGVSARSLVAGLVPTVDPLAWALVAAVVAAAAWTVGLRGGSSDPAGDIGPTASESDVRPGDAAGSARTDPSNAPAANGVYRAWVAMAERASGTVPDTQTPRSVARDAVDAGLDRDAVDRLTALFERVRYGPAAATDERERAAREALGEADGGREP